MSQLSEINNKIKKTHQHDGFKSFLQSYIPFLWVDNLADAKKGRKQ